MVHALIVGQEPKIDHDGTPRFDAEGLDFELIFLGAKFLALLVAPRAKPFGVDGIGNVKDTAGGNMILGLEEMGLVRRAGKDAGRLMGDPFFEGAQGFVITALRVEKVMVYHLA